MGPELERAIVRLDDIRRKIDRSECTKEDGLTDIKRVCRELFRTCNPVRDASAMFRDERHLPPKGKPVVPDYRHEARMCVLDESYKLPTCIPPGTYTAEQCIHALELQTGFLLFIDPAVRAAIGSRTITVKKDENDCFTVLKRLCGPEATMMAGHAKNEFRLVPSGSVRGSMQKLTHHIWAYIEEDPEAPDIDRVTPLHIPRMGVLLYSHMEPGQSKIVIAVGRRRDSALLQKNRTYEFTYQNVSVDTIDGEIVALIELGTQNEEQNLVMKELALQNEWFLSDGSGFERLRPKNVDVSGGVVRVSFGKRTKTQGKIMLNHYTAAERYELDVRPRDANP